MTQFNIIGRGFLELEETNGISLKTENQQFRFADISLGRSVQFAVPATDYNRLLLGFAEDPAETGEACRRVYDAQMVYDGGERAGAFAVTGYTGNSFSCVFYIDGATWIDDLQKKKLADCVCTLPAVVWSTVTPVVDANAADPSQGVQIIKYENGTPSIPTWQLVPSVNIHEYIDNLLTNMGIQHDISDLSTDLWMTAASMKGGGDDAVTLATTAPTSATETESVAGYYFEVVNISLMSYRTGFGAIFNPTYTPAKGFKVKQNITATFPMSFPSDVYCWKYDNVWASRYVELGYGAQLRGAAVTLKKDDIIFFSQKPFGNYDPRWPYIGWKEVYYPFSVTIDVQMSADLSSGELWKVQNNAPDMTIFEYLKSVAVATGLELFVDAIDGISLKQNSYAGVGDFKSLDKVISIDEVKRCVSAWGEGARQSLVKFESEDYVEEPINAPYNIENEQNEAVNDVVSKFSEGGIGTNGVLIQDVDSSGKFLAKKWTICRVDTTATDPTWLQRIETPDVFGCDDIAYCSTCVKMKISATDAEFMALQPSTTFIWRGVAYIWTDADWSNGVMSLTLQKVSTPEPPVPNRLYFEAVTENAEIGFFMDDIDSEQTFLPLFEYSLDEGITWQSYTINRSINDPTVAAMITLENIGDKVLFRGKNDYVTKSDARSILRCIITGQVNAGGDITSILNGVGGDVPLTHYAFVSMFYVNCAGLLTMPNLPSTLLGNYCYANMFGQTGISSATLPALVLKTNSYSNMFRYCSQLNNVKTYMEDISATNCILGWLGYVAASGTLTCKSDLILPSGDSGLPTGWTRANL